MLLYLAFVYGMVHGVWRKWDGWDGRKVMDMGKWGGGGRGEEA